MKKLLLVLLVIPSILFGQSDVPDKYWLDDSNYEDVINGKEAFGDDEIEIKIVEFWAKFNEENCFADWGKLQDVQYYRVDIAKSPIAKKKYRVRMAPTLFIIVAYLSLTSNEDKSFVFSRKLISSSLKCQTSSINLFILFLFVFILNMPFSPRSLETT